MPSKYFTISILYSIWYYSFEINLYIRLIYQIHNLVYSSFEWNSLSVLLINLLPYKSLDRKCCEHNSEKHSKGKSRFLLASCWPETDINQHCSTGILLHAKSTLGRILYIYLWMFQQHMILSPCFRFLLKLAISWL